MGPVQSYNNVQYPPVSYIEPAGNGYYGSHNDRNYRPVDEVFSAGPRPERNVYKVRCPACRNVYDPEKAGSKLALEGYPEPAQEEITPAKVTAMREDAQERALRSAEEAESCAARSKEIYEASKVKLLQDLETVTESMESEVRTAAGQKALSNMMQELFQRMNLQIELPGSDPNDNEATRRAVRFANQPLQEARSEGAAHTGTARRASVEEHPEGLQSGPAAPVFRSLWRAASSFLPEVTPEEAQVDVKAWAKTLADISSEARFLDKVAQLINDAWVAHELFNDYGGSSSTARGFRRSYESFLITGQAIQSYPAPSQLPYVEAGVRYGLYLIGSSPGAVAYCCSQCDQDFDIPSSITEKIGLGEMIRSRLRMYRDRHLQAAAEAAFYYNFMTIPSVVFSASTTIISSLWPEGDGTSQFDGRLVLALVSSLNTVIISVSALFGFQGKKETHGQAGKLYETLLTALEYRVQYYLTAAQEGTNLHEGESFEKIDSELKLFMLDCEKQIKSIDSNVPVVPRHIKELVAASYRAGQGDEKAIKDLENQAARMDKSWRALASIFGFATTVYCVYFLLVKTAYVTFLLEFVNARLRQPATEGAETYVDFIETGKWIQFTMVSIAGVAITMITFCVTRWLALLVYASIPDITLLSILSRTEPLAQEFAYNTLNSATEPIIVVGHARKKRGVFAQDERKVEESQGAIRNKPDEVNIQVLRRCIEGPSSPLITSPNRNR